MAMVAAALRREGKRVITVRSSILYDKCMHLATINLNLQRTTPSGSPRAHHTFFSNTYKKPGAGYFERRYSSAAKLTFELGKEITPASEEELKAKGVPSLCSEASHSVISAQFAKAHGLETKPTAPTTVTIEGERYTCDAKCVLDWEMQNKKFTWTFLVMPSHTEYNVVLGVDWMWHVSPLALEVGGRSLIIAMPNGMRWVS